MIHSVGDKSTNGSVAQGVKYVLGEKDHNGIVREDVTILEGNPDLLISIEKGMSAKHTYVHTSLSFTEQESEMLNADDDKLYSIVESYRQQLAACLPDTDADRLTILAVKHNEKDKFHIHFITLRHDIETGKTYQPFIKQRGDVQRFNDWNITMQKEHGLENPNSAKHQRSAGWSKNLPEKVKDIRNEVDRVINEEISNGNIKCRDDIIKFISKTDNMKIGRAIPSAISISVDGHKQNIKFTGSVYNEHFTSTRELSSIIEERATVDYEGAKQRLSESMQKLADRSSRYSQTDNQMVGANADNSINSSISRPADVDVGREQTTGNEIQQDHGATGQNDRREAMVSSSGVSARSKKPLGVTSDNKEIKTPDHKIFNGVEHDKLNDSWAWKGSYGYVHVQATENGYTLSHGSKMEWTMAAQLLKENGATQATITCSTEQSMIRALHAHIEAGVKITGIKLNGKNLSNDEMRERLQDYDTTTKFTRDSIADGRISEKGSTSSDIDSIKQTDEHRDKLIERQIDDFEQSSNQIESIINRIESDIEQQLEEEIEIDEGFTF